MGIQALGRAQMQKMRRLGKPGTETVTFRLYDSVAYDPVSGTATEPDVEITFDCFTDKGATQETKAGSIITTDYVLTFEEGLLPRRPLTQDEVVILGTLYKVKSVDCDPMEVCLRVGVEMA
jgi:hypothetical protein